MSKRFVDVLKKLGRHADASVRDVKAKEHSVVVKWFNLRGKSDSAAIFVVLDAVVQQVNDNLTNMSGASNYLRIADEMCALIPHRYIVFGRAEFAQHNCIVAELFKVK